jgi:Uma2 family endonuclease
MDVAADLAWPTDRPLTITDLARIPDDGRKYELWDGILMITPGPTLWHQELSRRFCLQVNAQVGRDWVAMQEIMIEFGAVSRALQPDAVVLRSEIIGPRSSYPKPGDIPVVVEVESPNTKLYDRNTKPLFFAQGPVPVYVRIEVNKLGMPTVIVHQLVDGEYHEADRSGAGKGSVTLPDPISVTIDVAELAVQSDGPSGSNDQ